jgi:hypothetical protein
MTKTRSGRICMAAVWRSGAIRGPGRSGALRPDLVYVVTFRKIAPRTSKWSRKTPRAILYKLRKKSGAKNKYRQSHSNSTTQIPPLSDPPCTYMYPDIGIFVHVCMYTHTKFSIELQGRAIRNGYLVTRITVTLSIFDCST